jgi:F0F1-type ATP synthase epsilon subunit
MSYEEAKTTPDSTKATNAKPTLHIKVYSPYKIYFNEDADTISAENDTGPFDILVGHHNFMTLLTPCELIIRGISGEQRIKITRGLMHVNSNKVIVFLDI